MGRSEHGEELKAVGKEFQCLHCEVYVPDPPLGSSAYNYLSYLFRFFNQRDLYDCQEGRAGGEGEGGALPLQLPTPGFGG